MLGTGSNNLIVKLGDQIMSDKLTSCHSHTYSPIEMHKIVRNTGKPNFRHARLPVTSHLNVPVLQDLLKD